MNRLLLAVCIVIWNTAAAAAPVVTGVSVFADRQLASISGTGFGQKVPAAPFKWDDFDSGAPGDFVAPGDGPPWSLFATLSNLQPRYSVSRSRYEGDVTCLQEFGGGNYNSTLALFDVPAAKWYVSAWYYDDSQGAVSRNEKVLSWRGARLGAPDTNPQFRYGLDYGSGHTYVTDCSGNDRADDWRHPLKREDEWRRLECFYDAGTPAGGGRVQTWDNCTPEVSLSGTFVDADCNVTCLYFHHYYATSDGDGTPSSQNWYWSEIYVDTTLARVEVGDASQWDACTHREIQIPVSWSEEQIQITARQGSFASGQQLYLYVVDGNGEVNQEGFPVMFMTEDPGPPGLPGRPVRTP